MSNGKASPQGILRCRDLTTLLYGVPMVATLVERGFSFGDDSQHVILQQDMRRIRYEIIIKSNSATAQSFHLGSLVSEDSDNSQHYRLPPNSSMVITRDFRSDLDGVTISVWVVSQNEDVFISTRETILTPAPVDEIPLP